ncbi:MAG: class I SAM-dependent methyltransferase [Gammaproteobacteria bacterium]|nr:class I SAM-dependent methyltransferase [Gammaproteobacteria bacterium]MYD79140.1 class I SAM-dependent methyltransferase [Gammaproteobacteria bacterium]
MSLALDLLKRLVKDGTLQVVMPDGGEHNFGSGEPSVSWLIRKKGTLGKIARNPFMNLGETYIDQEWDVQDNRLSDLLTVLRANLESSFSIRSPLFFIPALVQSWNNISLSLSNVAHHYDIDERLFRNFLDSDMHYSCAYFPKEDMSLEAAQQAKCEHIAKKLCLKPNAKVLDIGSGWGSLAMHLAENYDVSVTGITLSNEQLRVAEERAAERNLGNRVKFELQDYRNHEGKYDGIVSVGMFEHVGKHNFLTYFKKVKSLLTKDGLALIHTIGSHAPPTATNPWIRKHIFPGGYIPSLSEVSKAIENSGLIPGDIEVWRRHYASTLEEWNRRFQNVREEFVRTHGEKFCRIWEFYLCASQTAFELASLLVFQFQLGHRNDSAPLTRDYVYE